MPHSCNHSSSDFRQTAHEVIASKHKRSFNPLVKKHFLSFLYGLCALCEFLAVNSLPCLLTPALQCLDWPCGTIPTQLCQSPTDPGTHCYSRWGTVSPHRIHSQIYSVLFSQRTADICSCEYNRVISEYLSALWDHTWASLSKSGGNLSLCIISPIKCLIFVFVFFWDCNINLGAAESL